MTKTILNGLLLTLLWATGYGSPARHIAIQTSGGKTVALQEDDLSGIKTKPLRQLKKKWDGKFKKSFLHFKKISITPGQTLEGSCKIENGPLRLSIYRVSKQKKKARHLQVLSTGFHKSGMVADIRAKVTKTEEDVFFITAEKVTSATQLNSHLSYLASQDNAVILKGYSTNWNLSALKLKMVGKKGKTQDDIFVKDADWLIGQLINPAWIVSIRVETQ